MRPSDEFRSSPSPSGAVARALWISWERHRRTEALAAWFAIPLVVVEHGGPAPIRYPLLAARTIMRLIRARPSSLVVQNPSLVLAALAALLRPVLRYQLILDTHNCALEPAEGGVGWRSLAGRWLLRSADRTIVTNTALAARVETLGGRAIVLPDRIPTAPRRVDPTAPHIGAVLVSSFASDEPIEAVLASVPLLGASTQLTVTGNWQAHRHRLPHPLPRGVRLTGFLAEDEYWKLLASAGVVIDLSLMADNLPCGAYEAVAVGIPMVLSDDTAVRSHFSAGVVYTAPEPEQIAAAVTHALAERPKLLAQVVALREELSASWLAHADGLSRLLD